MGRSSWAADTLNVRVLLEHSGHPPPPTSRRYSVSPVSYQEPPARKRSVRRKRSRSELKDYGAQQNLHEIARGTLKNGDDGGGVRSKEGNGSVAD